eukprot:4301321-Pyramimonas_sp.AAC.1
MGAGAKVSRGICKHFIYIQKEKTRAVFFLGPRGRPAWRASPAEARERLWRGRAGIIARTRQDNRSVRSRLTSAFSFCGWRSGDFVARARAAWLAKRRKQRGWCSATTRFDKCCMLHMTYGRPPGMIYGRPPGLT